ncbi:MAG: SMC-Scp complex subunit ScpB [Candidatus Glassbacteria bacterium]|nr:SMC-Scp complex subunit ScpB [Candidatus Glassbacteria bacterium]
MSEYSNETVIEAMLFASSEPVDAARLAVSAEMEEELVHQAVRTLNEHYESSDRAFRVMEISGGYQYRTVPELAEYVRGLGRQSSSQKLSPAALETLAIIAYRQPITRVEVEKIRGVNPSGVLKTLLEKRLITICGRAQILGRPLLYGTTPEFLRYFGLSGLDSLPRESELEVILSEQESQTVAPAAGDFDDSQQELV